MSGTAPQATNKVKKGRFAGLKAFCTKTNLCSRRLNHGPSVEERNPAPPSIR